MWVRFHKCYSVLIRNSLSRLNSSSRSSLSFSRLCCSSASATATALSTGRHTSRRQPRVPPPEDVVFLQLRDKSVYVTEPQACDDLSKWTVLLGSSVVCGPGIENISFIIEATGHRVGYPSPHTSNKKVGTTHWTNNFLRPVICNLIWCDSTLSDFSEICLCRHVYYKAYTVSHKLQNKTKTNIRNLYTSDSANKQLQCSQYQHILCIAYTVLKGKKQICV